MLLAIDSGNTNVVFGVFGEAGLLKAFRCANDPGKTADELIVWLADLMALNDIDHRAIDATIIASVVPETKFNLVSLCRRYFMSEPMVIGDVQLDLGMQVLIARPEQAGADRLINALEAHASYGGPLICIDFGTATTFDVVNGQGDYIGGIIAPGITLSLRALHMASAQLPLVEIACPEQVIGRDTTGAMQSGVFWGYVAMIEGLVTRITNEHGTAMKVVATGGLADLFARRTPIIDRTDRALTLRGLARVHARNRDRLKNRQPQEK